MWLLAIAKRRYIQRKVITCWTICNQFPQHYCLYLFQPLSTGATGEGKRVWYTNNMKRNICKKAMANIECYYCRKVQWQSKHTIVPSHSKTCIAYKSIFIKLGHVFAFLSLKPTCILSYNHWVSRYSFKVEPNTEQLFHPVDIQNTNSV